MIFFVGLLLVCIDVIISEFVVVVVNNNDGGEIKVFCIYVMFGMGSFISVVFN